MQEKINDLIHAANSVVIIQADNPDGDSLGTALALEHIIADMGKEPYLYCGVTMPTYLSYFSGADRVTSELPSKFDLSIIVDTSAISLLDTAKKSNSILQLKTKPCVVLDHHQGTDNSIEFATAYLNEPAVATSELLYELALSFKWPLNLEAKNALTAAIMADSLGLTSGATTARSIAIISELVAGGVKLAELEARRRDQMRKSPEMTRYKGELLQRIEYYETNKIATITIPWEEIEQYSHDYNPSVLVLEDMRMTTGTDVAIAFKVYPNNKVTGKIRCNFGKPVAKDLAEHFGGGGHAYTSGFKVQDGRPFNEIKSECIQLAADLLNNLDKENSDETLQYTDA